MFPGTYTNFFPLLLKDDLSSQLGASNKVCDMLGNIIQAHSSVTDNFVVDSNLSTPPESINEMVFSTSIWNTEFERHQQRDTELNYKSCAMPSLSQQGYKSERSQESDKEDSNKVELAQAYIPCIVSFQQWEDEVYATSNALCVDSYLSSD